MTKIFYWYKFGISIRVQGTAEYFSTATDTYAFFHLKYTNDVFGIMICGVCCRVWIVQDVQLLAFFLLRECN